MEIIAFLVLIYVFIRWQKLTSDRPLFYYECKGPLQQTVTSLYMLFFHAVVSAKMHVDMLSGSMELVFR